MGVRTARIRRRCRTRRATRVQIPNGIRPMKLNPRADSPWTVPMTVEVWLKAA